LRTKLKLNYSKSTINGGNILMKSNLMKADSMINFRLNENTDMVELKKVLLTLIADT
jgi:hypothetical protein